MPLQNRVQPDGEIIATPERGLFYGNRGGGFHIAGEHRLHSSRRWGSKQWICCVLEFKNRKRPLMQKGFTELFFLDEVTALAAGHRPCFECRRADAVRFASAWRDEFNMTHSPKVAVMDGVLHGERINLADKSKRTTERNWQDVPHGAMVEIDGKLIANHKGKALIWSSSGYLRAQTLILAPTQVCNMLTPPAIADKILNRYEPVWHPSAIVASNGAL